MKVVKKPYQLTGPLIKRQEIQNTEYRDSVYTFKSETDDGLLIYNIMTGEMILSQQPADRNYLISHWFLVPVGFDEHAQMAELKKHYFENSDTSKGLNFCTVLTTTKCNADCFYCYEKNLPQQTMSKQQALEIAHYLAEQADKEEIVLDWYGGEPLVNDSVIDIICESLKKDNINYSTMMISNGYLITPEIVKRATELWKLKRIQITIDGLNEKYSKIKNYKNGDKNAFFKVMENIRLLIHSDIHVEIRLNVDYYNIDDIEALIEYLTEKFSFNKNVNIYLHLLFQNHSGYRMTHSEEEWNYLIKRVIDIENKLFDNGLFECGLRSTPRVNACLADNKKACTIMPNGDIIRCRDYLDAVPAGNAISNTVVFDVVRAWELLSEEFEKCKKCKIYPECNRLQMCTEHTVCQKMNVLHKENTIKLSMKSTYSTYKQVE